MDINALAAYMNRPDRIRSVLEYYLGEKLLLDWICEEIKGFLKFTPDRYAAWGVLFFYIALP